jgi:hypothetical protein
VPAVPLDAHSHTGFFLRMGIGAGYIANATTLEGPTFQGQVDAAGGAFTLELDIGGALSPGIILAGSYTVHSVGNAKLTNDTRSYRPAHDPSLTMLAAMLDVYPDPKAGFHFGGALGFASFRVREDTDAQASSAGQSGFGLAPHVGYEWWVSNYWGIGVLGRFIFARTQGDYAADGKEKDTVTGAAILFSATYN